MAHKYSSVLHWQVDQALLGHAEAASYVWSLYPLLLWLAPQPLPRVSLGSTFSEYIFPGVSPFADTGAFRGAPANHESQASSRLRGSWTDSEFHIHHHRGNCEICAGSSHFPRLLLWDSQRENSYQGSPRFQLSRHYHLFHLWALIEHRAENITMTRGFN